ncbi:efflux RND transporter periplasmic adaptor subunit [Anaeromicrobium sediminis]|uniref:Uncharacterized protein n=1 Tax=Anaeromicrobium sediminis TaxID=1478221 RepID=A0A267MJP2_9FIRM|nr:efflux RND transporter periplasmic adaptor subunit [Anaeromicrobium sediminis]PAB59789.1 hypothetical protein CCE28_07480 [Anaeromicrobium sediminis]
MSKKGVKKLLVIPMIVVILFSARGLLNKKATSENKILGRPVKVLEVESSTYGRTLKYTGVIGEDNLRKISFQSPGKIEKIYVKDSEKVSKGQILATMDTTSLDLKEKELIEQLSILDTQLEMNKKDYDFILTNYEKTKKLYESGVISKNALDEMELKYDKTKLGLDTVKKQKNQVMAQYDSIKKSIEDGTIRAVEDGYVVDVIGKEGENTSPSAPVIIQRGETQIVNVGISQRDMNTIKINQKTYVSLNDISKEGAVTNIQKSPDQRTNLYMIDIEIIDKFSQEDFLVGAIVDVTIKLGDEKGIWIPVKSVLNDGEDYVYVIKDERAFKKIVSIEEIDENRVLVKGLSEEDKLVISGMSNLKDGYLVNIKK